MLGVSPGKRGRGDCCGSPRAGRSLGSRRDGFLTSQDGFWVPLVPQTPRAAPCPFFGGDRLRPGPPGPMCPGSAPSLLATPSRCGSPWRRGGRSRRGGPGRPDSVVGASRGGLSDDPEHRRGSRGRTCAGPPSGRGPRAGACVSLALCCSERPRLCWDRRRCVSKGESLEVEGGTSPRKWLVNDRNDP